jgi:sugar phosphate isomerase/epimerase
MKVGVSSYSFSQYMNNTKANIFQVIDKAKELGFTSIEFTSVYAPEGKCPIEQAKDIKAYCADKGLYISSYTIGADLLNDPKGSVENLKKELKIAEALGVKLMRHDVCWGFPASKKSGRSFDDAIPVVAPAAREVTEYAKELGIKTMFENHGFFAQDSDRVEKLLNAINSENFGLLLDMGNFLCVDEDPSKAVGKLLPYILHVHTKDFFVRDGLLPNPGAGWFTSRGGNYLRGTIVGQGNVPIMKCVRMIKNSGYTGNFSIEFEGIEDNIFALTTGLANLNSYFPD